MTAFMHSGMYHGVVAHVRTQPTRHSLRYRLCMFYLDLDELPQVLSYGRLASADRRACVRFNAGDYLTDHAGTLKERVAHVVSDATGATVNGPIRLLTHPRYWGYIFNPVSFFYVFDARGTQVEFVVAEITNTPWQERHSYVLDCRQQTTREFEFKFDKAFHISPFMGMRQQYQWRLQAPADVVNVNMVTLEHEEPIFNASMRLEYKPLSQRAVLNELVRFPAMTAKVTAGIYWNALLLKLKGTPFHAHPDTRPHRDTTELQENHT